MANVIRKAAAGAGMLAVALNAGIAMPASAKEDARAEDSINLGKPAQRSLGVEYVVLRDHFLVILAGLGRNNRCLPTINLPKSVHLEPLNDAEYSILGNAIRKACRQIGAEWREEGR